MVDVRSVVLLASLMASLMSLVLFFQWRNYPSSIRGLGHWTAAPMMLSCTTLLGALRGSLPDLLTIAIPSVMLFAGLYLAYLGTQRFLEQPTAVPRWTAFITLTTIPALWFTVVEPNFRVRLLIMAPPMALLLALHARLIFRHGPRSFAGRLLLVTLSAGTLYQLLRVVMLGIMPPEESGINPALLPAPFVIAYVVIVLLTSVGLVLLANERLRIEYTRQSVSDPLTDAYTRHHMNLLCEQELARSRYYGHTLSLLLIDLDHLKAVNDTFGQQRGDQLLVELVAQVKTLLRPDDRLGRYSGKEFLLLLPRTALPEAQALAERIRLTVERTFISPRCTVTIGLTTSQPDGDTLDRLLARANKALALAEDQGFNHVASA
jgi:diguanylate cyclase (GGDEF)-like protein